ncbi:MAG TPA: DUF309 domain-containing protein [Candidatus Binatia bacterium]|nr:DUF309 domain-containing protein [Candidatus Binatia bacterium]
MPTEDIPAPAIPPQRYTSTPFPSYRFVPGRHPHPTRDPRGHSYRADPLARRDSAWRPDDWRSLDAWLYGIDLFNARYFWEAHEAWESVWAAAPRASVAALLLQGLIQIAAALLKSHMGVPLGARTLSEEGLDKLRHVAAHSPKLMGLAVTRVVGEFEGYWAPNARGELPTLDNVPLLTLS